MASGSDATSRVTPTSNHDGELDVDSGRCILYARGPQDAAAAPEPLDRCRLERTTADIDG
jgi:hypothetical protein